MRTLIVDDSRAFLEAARETLERGGVDVVGVATSASEAVARALRLRPDVVLVDLHLGRESGLDVVRRLAQDRTLDRVTLVVMSTSPEEDIRTLVEESPAAGFVAKLDLSAHALERLRRR